MALQASRARRRRLYHSAKISDQLFRRVLREYVQDTSATDAAGRVGLSVNSVAALYHKLRVFFTEVGLFADFYEGMDPMDRPLEADEFEKALLEYHFQRVREKRGLKVPPGEPDLHFFETFWRMNFQMMQRERPTADVRPMMFEHLMALIGLCGPVGRKAGNRRAGLREVHRQQDQYAAWLERNAPGFATPERREALREIRAIQPTRRMARAKGPPAQGAKTDAGP